MEIKHILTIKVPSKSEPETLRTVEVYSDGQIICSCPAKPTVFCRHRKIMVRYLLQIIQKLKMNKVFDYHEARESVAKRMSPATG